MQVEMIWENGVLRPVRPLHFKRRTITVEVADADVEPVAQPGQFSTAYNAATNTAATDIAAELNALMKAYRGQIPAAEPREDKAAWHEHLGEKHLNRDR